MLTAARSTPAPPKDDTTRLSVISPGPLTTVQDQGRTGYAHLGVSPSGAADRASFALANRLVGNFPGTPALECTFGGLSIRLDAARVVALTGAPVPALVNGRPVADPTRFRLTAGDVLSLGRPSVGLRTYLAISGGLLVEPVLGGAGHDVLAGHGPHPLRAGDEFAIGVANPCPQVPVELAISRLPQATTIVRFRWGPRHELFDRSDRQRLTTTWWRVSADSNRVGVRLQGDPLRIGNIHLPSEGMVRGAIQVPPSGEPIVFLADHPVTGGYPVIGAVIERDLDLVAQAPPGIGLRFQPISSGSRIIKFASRQRIPTSS
ncbi:biotin-dependent carboxyltransferase family protein [Saccharopolyspora spinosa]|uniref:Biotin-dependent carboxylase-like uncharacterized protein n=1 Tax=Saccharopolyspora spinosa TaxID=60894 RepID=A0A2N3XZF6_SACSN|nr:biotin-dependent carboxyltransferase family protein [Saccharopolyspora spinosa]PKW16053.1 biotin-dependent carboxylase-like uncharacterized protein [Saccharopolyspora spinosa]